MFSQRLVEACKDRNPSFVRTIADDFSGFPFAGAGVGVVDMLSCLPLRKTICI